MNAAKELVDFLFEAGELKRVKRSGWWTAKIKDPESVAEHSFRTGLAAYVLALMEGGDEREAAEVAVAALAHDLHEARTLDLHKIAAKYFDKSAAEEKAAGEQGLEFKLTAEQKRVAGDADLVEVILQAKEYSDAGFKDAALWIAEADDPQPRLANAIDNLDLLLSGLKNAARTATSR